MSGQHVNKSSKLCYLKLDDGDLPKFVYMVKGIQFFLKFEDQPILRLHQRDLKINDISPDQHSKGTKDH